MAPVGLMQVSGVAAGALVAVAWEGLVLAGVVALCLRMLPGISAAARSVVWIVVMLAVCGLPFLHFGGAASETSGSQVHVDERFGLGLVAVWLLISLVRSGQLVRSAVWLWGISRRAIPVSIWNGASKGNYADAGSATMTALELVTSVGGRAAELCVSAEVDRPCVVGFFRPRVLVPMTLFAGLSDGELRQIVLHEMEHLRRRDDWTNLLQKLSLVVFPLNPALVWIERQLCVERELACDDRVLKATGARKAYAACLANLAEHTLVRRGVSLALGAWERQSEVVRRVHRILAGSKKEMGVRQAAGVVALIVLGVAGVADGLAHAPELVRFGPGLAVAAVQDPAAKAPLYNEAQFVGLKTHANPMVQVRAQDVVFRVPPVAVKAKRRVRKVIKPMVAAMAPAPFGLPKQGRPAHEVVMVTWQVGPVLVRDAQFMYEAVPTWHGWVFVQL